MDLHQRQQFDFLLQTATERFATRLEERHRGAQAALALLEQDPHAEGVALRAFVAAVFEDFLLTSADGACFVLRAVPQRKLSSTPAGSTVEGLLQGLAPAVFAELLLQKTIETLGQHAAYQSV